MGAYKGNASTIKEAEERTQSPAYKKGGKAEKAHGGCMKKGGKIMSEAAKGKKPARASGGGVFSSAHGGTHRGAAPKPY